MLMVTELSLKIISRTRINETLSQELGSQCGNAFVEEDKEIEEEKEEE